MLGAKMEARVLARLEGGEDGARLAVIGAATGAIEAEAATWRLERPLASGSELRRRGSGCAAGMGFAHTQDAAGEGGEGKSPVKLGGGFDTRTSSLACLHVRLAKPP